MNDLFKDCANQECKKMKKELEELRQKNQEIQKKKRRKKKRRNTKTSTNTVQNAKDDGAILEDLLSTFKGSLKIAEEEDEGSNNGVKEQSKNKKDMETGQHGKNKPNDPKLSVEPKTPQQTAFSNSLIIRHILRFLTGKQVLTCRLIDLLWCEEATFELLRSPIRVSKFRVPFYWYREKGQFDHLKMGNLSEFTEFLDSRASLFPFPCEYFSFENGDLGSADAQLFFTKHGESAVRGLELDLDQEGQQGQQGQQGQGGQSDKKTDIDIFRILILDQLPNLSYLGFESTPPWTESDQRLFCTPKNTDEGQGQDHKTLPNLEKLRFGPCAKISTNLVFDLLTAALNLKVTEDNSVRFLDQLISSNRIHTVKEFICAVSSVDLDRLLTFAQTGPKLIRLGLSINDFRHSPEHWLNLITFLNKILQSSADTLKLWDRLPCTDFLIDLIIPALPKLKHVCIIEKTRHATFGFFPPTLNPIYPPIFPNVTAVIFQDQSDPVTSLARAQGTKTAAHWIKMIAPGFPQLQALDFQIVTMTDLPNFLKAVLTSCPNLKRLLCSLRYETKTLSKNLCAEIDSAITGIPLEMCKNIRQFLHQHAGCKKMTEDCPDCSGEITIKNTESLRQNPSILDLKELQLLRFYYRGVGILSSNMPCFSQVSYVYGFDILAKRQPFRVVVDHGFYQSKIVEELNA